MICLIIGMMACEQDQPKIVEELLNANLEATGGEENWRKLKTLKGNLQMTTEVAGNTMTSTMKMMTALPASRRMETYVNETLESISLNTLSVSSYVKFEEGRAVGYSAVPPSEIVVKQELDWLAGHNNLSMETAVRDKATVYQLIDKSSTDTFVYHSDTYLLIEKRSQTAYGHSTITFQDYKEVNGYKFAFTEQQDIPSAGYATKVKYTNIEVNTALPATTFEEDENWITLVKGKKVPEFSLPLLGNEKTFSNSDFKGKTVLIDFWATWCKPCIAEFPNLRNAYAKYHQAGFEILSISVDQNEQAFKRYLENNDLPWMNAFIQDGFNSEIGKKFQLASIPKPVLVNENGEIIALDNDIRGMGLERELEKIFGE